MTSDEWYIIPSKCGLVHPSEILVPFCITIKIMSAWQRTEWAVVLTERVRNNVSIDWTTKIVRGKTKSDRKENSSQLRIPAGYGGDSNRYSLEAS